MFQTGCSHLHMHRQTPRRQLPREPGFRGTGLQLTLVVFWQQVNAYRSGPAAYRRLKGPAVP